MSETTTITLPEDVKQRFPSLRYWEKKLQSFATAGTVEAIEELRSELAALRDELDGVQQTLDQIIRTLSEEPETDETTARPWLQWPHRDFPSGVNMSEIGNGYVTVENGAPSVVSNIPDSDIEYSQVAVTGTDVDWSAGRVFYFELAGDTALTFSNETVGKQVLIVIVQNASTAYACTFSDCDKWSGGIAPDLTSATTGSTNVFSFVCYDRGGTTEVVGTWLPDAK